MNNKKTALYRHYDAFGTLLYVGMSYSPVSRLANHINSAEWIEYAVRMEMKWFETRKEAEKAEIAAIKTENPKYNKEYTILFKRPGPSIYVTKEKQVRCVLVAPSWLKNAVVNASKNKGVSMAEYIKDSLKYTLKVETKQQ